VHAGKTMPTFPTSQSSSEHSTKEAITERLSFRKPTHPTQKLNCALSPRKRRHSASAASPPTASSIRPLQATGRTEEVSSGAKTKLTLLRICSWDGMSTPRTCKRKAVKHVRVVYYQGCKAMIDLAALSLLDVRWLGIPRINPRAGLTREFRGCVGR